MYNDSLKEKLVGALIGLARATDGNEHLITPSATAAVIESLAAAGKEAAADEEMLRSFLTRVEEEKRKMVPDCFLCASPCGRTSDFDLRLLRKADSDVYALKVRILSGIHRVASTGKELQDTGILFRALVVIGMEDYTAEDLLPVAAEVEELAAASL